MLMKPSTSFAPSRRPGLIFHIALLGILGGAAVYGLWYASQSEVGPGVLIALVPVLLVLGTAPWLTYRLYALRSAAYTLERDGIRLNWGLRQEVIPIDQIQWVRPARDYGAALPLPLLRWPGAVLGERTLSDQRKIEYMADRSHNLVLVATQQRIFALSPSQPAEFLRSYARYAELGSIRPLKAQSLFPSFLLARFSKDRPARWLVAGGLFLTLLLWVGAILAVPGQAQIPWHLSAPGLAAEYAPPMRLLLLPTLNSGAFVMDLLAGFFFYRKEEYKALSYLFWMTGLVTACLFAGGIFFILNFR